MAMGYIMAVLIIMAMIIEFADTVNHRPIRVQGVDSGPQRSSHLQGCRSPLLPPAFSQFQQIVLRPDALWTWSFRSYSAAWRFLGKFPTCAAALFTIRPERHGFVLS